MAFTIVVFIFFIIFIFSLAIFLLQTIGTWKMLVKAGKPGWGALIPIYREYLLCELSGVNTKWILLIFIGVLLNIIPILGSLVYSFLVIYFSILLYVSVARSFGISDVFAVGLILVNPIFIVILGCGSFQYLGKRPMNDFIFKNDNQEVYEQNSSTNNQESINNDNLKYCPSCGSKIMSNSSFCTNCGNKVK